MGAHRAFEIQELERGRPVVEAANQDGETIDLGFRRDRGMGHQHGDPEEGQRTGEGETGDFEASAHRRTEGGRCGTALHGAAHVRQGGD